MSFRRAFAVVLLCLGMLGVAMPGWATCSSPAGEAGQFGYASNYGVLAYCNGTNWISMAGGVSVTVGGTTGATTLHELSDVDDSAKASGTYLKYNGTSWVATNPFGTLTNAKWCTSDGSTINCTTDAPVRICGVKGSNGERPVITGANATHIANKFVLLFPFVHALLNEFATAADFAGPGLRYSAPHVAEKLAALAVRARRMLLRLPRLSRGSAPGVRGHQRRRLHALRQGDS